LMWYLSSILESSRERGLVCLPVIRRLVSIAFPSPIFFFGAIVPEIHVQFKAEFRTDEQRMNEWTQDSVSIRKAWTIRFPPNEIMNKAWKKRCDSSLHYHSQWRMNEINGMKSERWFPFHQCINEERTQILWPLSHSLFRNVIIILLYLHWRRTHSQFLGSFSVRRTDLSIWTSSSLSLSQTRRPLSPVSGHRRPRSLGFLLSGIGRVQKRRRRSIEECMNYRYSCGK